MPPVARTVFLAAIAAGLALALPDAWPRDVVAGPIEAEVIEVYDGDTFTARAHIWLGQNVVVNVRVNGLDTPEIKGKCDGERDLARKAKERAIELIGSGPVRLHDIQFGKYAGRVLARVATADGTDLAQALIAAGLARPYAGGRRQGWCGT